MTNPRRPLARDSTALVILLGCATALGPLSTDMYLPSLPVLVGLYGSDMATVQLTLSAFLAGFAVMQLVYGPLSDRFGRRRVLLAGVALYTLASIACAFAGSVEWLILWRFVQALGACAGVVLGRAIARDLYEGAAAARALSMMAMTLGLTPAVAPILGGYLHDWFGWQANFIAMALTGAALGVCVLFFLAESNRHINPQAMRPGPMLRNFGILARHARFRGYVLCIAFSYGGMFSFISASSFTLDRVFGVGPTEFGLCFLLIVIGYLIGGFIGTRFTIRFGVNAMLGLGAASCAAGGLLMLALQGWAWMAALTWHWFSLIGPMMLFTLGLGLTMPQGQAGALQPFPQMAGAAASLMGFVQMSVGAFAGIIVGHALNDTALPLSLAVAGMGTGTLLSYLLIVRRLARTPEA
ncbi:multidrug effflux MFS transporter [Ferrovibrio terrae]|uniref:Bcr/CflA family efflux transporter n=1 Tax=Ferrovibrio terrae TaxID=2594003 RepID=A0A516GWP5_9PROT|nr:multidrug effflux MFS transporter [Ferrovibrio terrae]QDO95912.1 multidrug effflux MFS transporter [Ferrovibrio terrae]